MNRRRFIKTTAAIGVGIELAPQFLKGFDEPELITNDEFLESDNVLIILELFGGNDGLNTIIPADIDEYYKLRPNIGIPKDEAVKVNDIYFNKALVQDIKNGGMNRMFEDGRLAIVEGIGYDQPNLSHFRSEDIWLSGINPKLNHKEKLLEGWLGRYFALKLPNYPMQIPEHPISISVDGAISLIFKSNKGDMGVALTDPDEFYKLGVGLTPKESLMQGNNNYENEYNFIHTIARQSDIYSQAVKTAYDIGLQKINGNLYSQTELSQKFKLISALVAGGLKTKVYFVKLSNFDSHAQQMNTAFTGQHYLLLNAASKAISEFMQDALENGFSERITGMTISEFGRRAYDNGSRGTDHGAASMQFIWGNDKFVNGGYWNNRPNLSDLDANGNVKYQTDYRVIYTEILEKRLGATPDDVEKVFGESFLPLNILEKRVNSIIEKNFIANKEILVTPNPNNGIGNFQFELKEPAFVDISIFNLTGRIHKTIQRSYLTEGYYKIPFTIGDSGTFIVAITAGNSRYTEKFTVIR
jgi:uncharacterized protein (DUF1501 family)